MTNRRCAYCDRTWQNANTSTQPYKCPECLGKSIADAVAPAVDCQVGTHDKTVVLKFPGHATVYLTPSIAKILADKLDDAAESIEPVEVFASRPQSVDGEPT